MTNKIILSVSILFITFSIYGIDNEVYNDFQSRLEFTAYYKINKELQPKTIDFIYERYALFGISGISFQS